MDLLESAMNFVRAIGAGHLEESALGDKSGVWLGAGHGGMCHMGRTVVTSRWGSLGQGHQGLEEQMIYGEHKQV